MNSVNINVKSIRLDKYYSNSKNIGSFDEDVKAYHS